MTDNLRYDNFLEKKEVSQKGSRKGERTRNRIKVSTAKLLNKMSYNELRVVDICDEAKIAPGTFYIYFENKTVVVEQVLTEFIDMFRERVSQIQSNDPFESIHLANMLFLENAHVNAGLNRCVFGMRTEQPEFSKLHQEANIQIYKKIAERVSKNVSGTRYELAFIGVHAMGSMMDEVASRIAFNDTPYLEELLGGAAGDDEAYCECLSIIWYRTLYGSAPTDVKTKLARQFLAISD